MPPLQLITVAFILLEQLRDDVLFKLLFSSFFSFTDGILDFSLALLSWSPTAITVAARLLL